MCKAWYTLATKLNSTRSTLLNRQQIGNKVERQQYVDVELCWTFNFVASLFGNNLNIYESRDDPVTNRSILLNVELCWAFNFVECSTLLNFVELCSTMFNFVQLCLTCSTMFNYVQLCSALFNFVQLCSTLFNFVQLCLTLFNFV